MSYCRKFHKTIAVPYTGTVSYPASPYGGTTSYSGTVCEDVEINIEVDTDSFDQSIDNCNSTVNLLTNAIATGEAAQIASIDKNAKKVAHTVITGFFGYIRSEISQQVMELSKKMDACLLHLHEMAKSCIAKQKQMETDYNRLSSRYLKIFDDLNKELENRIFTLDKPAFVFKNDSDKQAIRTTGSDLVSDVTVFGSESGELQAKISASVAKKQAWDAINRATIFMLKQKKLQSSINQSMLNGNITVGWFSPVCFIETSDEDNQTRKNMYISDFLLKTNPDKLKSFKTKLAWVPARKEQKENIQRYFNSEVGNAYTSDDRHKERVNEMIIKIFNINSIKSI